MIGITGTGGAGKSSVTDELLNRFLASFPRDAHRGDLGRPHAPPHRRRAARRPHPHELAAQPRASTCARWPRAASTRRPTPCSRTASAFLKGLGYDLVIVETAGIGQSDSEIVDLVDFPMYVMTSDFGAPSQLEKIDMLDFAELVVLNKYDKRGAEDALRDVRKQWKRNRVAFQTQGRGRPGLSDHRQPVQRPRHQLDVRQPVPPAAREAVSCRRRSGRRDSTPR